MSADTARAATTASVPAWQRTLADAVRDPATLLQALDLDPELLPAARRAAGGFTLRGSRPIYPAAPGGPPPPPPAAPPPPPPPGLFPLRVPWPYLRRMRRGDPHDPLLRQVLPLGAEAADTPGFGDDPVGDGASLVDGGVLHKYRGRALLVATGACAIHCRYCFRRHFPYAEANAAAGGWQGALDYLRARPDIHEVLLSGGDPLALRDRRLADLAQGLDAIPHLRRIRVHSRLPVVVPERVDDGLLGWLAGGRLRPVLVIHANHPAELDEAVAAAMARLRGAGVALYNQAVLLRGVNDDAGVLEALGERLFDLGVQPYYLHLLDRVRGAAHFEVPEAEARALMRALAARASGYLLPRLVREEAGQPWKTPVDWTRTATTGQ